VTKTEQARADAMADAETLRTTPAFKWAIRLAPATQDWPACIILYRLTPRGQPIDGFEVEEEGYSWRYLMAEVIL
jgi:hypothetical protein